MLLTLAYSGLSLSVVLDSTRVGRRFDGHGGLSAGASSRLLFDYDASTRSDILDYLYKPFFGAALSICKVEIGGDVQSTNGAEASHMHTSKDLSLTRGYEWWLMAEAKQRNPDIVTYALSWGTPGWVGNGSYFTEDNIAYQTAFVKGAKSQYNVSIDYIGIWNERPWGNADYVIKLRESLDAAGFVATEIVGSDGTGFAYDPKHIALLHSNKTFAEAEHIQGGHYTCAHDAPEDFWTVKPEQSFWVNEDFSTLGGDWAAGGCWGRSLLQNFVKLNATSTISWSTIWAVTDSWRYFGNGLMYAYEPWSGNYTVPPPIWTSAHVTQFAVPGWHYLAGPGGSGLLAGGGSWTAMIPPAAGTVDATTMTTVVQSTLTMGNDGAVAAAAAAGDFTLVVEKLDGSCLRCSVAKTTAETVDFTLAGSLLAAKPTALATWITNSSVSFLKLADTPVAKDGTFSFIMPADTIITLTTTTGQAKGHAASCSARTPTMCTGVYAPFPFPFSTTYDEPDAVEGRFAKFHADNAGAFEIRKDKTSGGSGSGGHLLQASPRYPKGTEWAGNTDPITSLGATDWVNARANVSVLLRAPTPSYAVGDPRVPFPTSEGVLTDPVDDPISTGIYGGVCVRQIDQYSSGVCLLLGVGLAGQLTSTSSTGWVLQAGAMGMKREPGVIMASGVLLNLDLTKYHTLSLAVQGATYVAVVDGVTVVDATHASFDAMTTLIPPVGQVALRSSFSYVQFDDLSIDAEHMATNNKEDNNNMLFVKHLLYPPKPAPGGPQQPVKILPGADGHFGCKFTLTKDATVTALARFAVAPTGAAASKSHNVVLMDATTLVTVASAVVDLAAANGGDLNGYAWTPLAKSTTLKAGTPYILASEEKLGGDSFYAGTVWVTTKPGLMSGLVTAWNSVTPPPASSKAWHYIVSASTQECWDTPGSTSIDTWDCVEDGHNEGFNYSATTGLITIGPQSHVAAAVGQCFLGAIAKEEEEHCVGKLCFLDFPSTSAWAPCDAKNPLMVYTHGVDETLRLRGDSTSCLTSGPKGNNAGILLTKCASPPSRAQMWTFTPNSGNTPGPAGSTVSEWSQCYGPLNARLQ